MKVITLFFSIITSLTTIGQGFNKKVPVKLTRYDIALFSNKDFTQDFTAKKEFVNNTGKLTLEQFTQAMTLANESNFPEGMKTPRQQLNREKEILNYKAYWQGSWLQANPAEGWAQTLHLIWIPQDENQRMPEDLKPTDKAGFFLVVANLGISLDSLPKLPVPPATFMVDMKKKHSKNEPARMDSASEKVFSSYGESMQFAYNELVVKGKYTDAEFARIAALATDKNWPKAFSTGKFDDAHDKAYEDMSKYKAYKITRLVDNSLIADLLWIPKEENKHMPPSMQPLTEEGFFVVVRIEKKEDPYLTYLLRANTAAGRLGLNIAGKPKANAASSSVNIVATTKKSTEPKIVATTTSATKASSSQPSAPTTDSKTNSYTTSSGIQVTTGVDMSEFTNNSRLGTMMLFYGHNGKASAIYMYELRGKSLSDKQGVVSKLSAKISISTPFIGFEWLPGYNCNMAKGYVYKKTNSTNGTSCQGEFKIN